jgi:hypothetical protein
MSEATQSVIDNITEENLSKPVPISDSDTDFKDLKLMDIYKDNEYKKQYFAIKHSIQL